jgi:hypothetical protein
MAVLLALTLGLATSAVALAQAPDSLKEIEARAKYAAGQGAVSGVAKTKDPAANPADSAEERNAATGRAAAVESSARYERISADARIRSEYSDENKALFDAELKHKIDIEYRIRFVSELQAKQLLSFSDFRNFLDIRPEASAVFRVAKKRLETVRDARFERAAIHYGKRNLDAWTPALGEDARQKLVKFVARHEAEYKTLSEKARDYERQEKAHADKEHEFLADMGKKIDAVMKAKSKDDEYEIDKVRRALRGELYRLNAP